ATVDENGKVTALKMGEAVITVTTKDGEKTASCTVSVVAPDNILDMITDPAFLAYAKYRMNASQGVSAAWDTNGDGILSPDEAAEVSTIIFDTIRNYEGSDLKVASLDGIEYFWNLRTLEVENQELTEIDLSNNLQIGSLRCKNNRLTKLNISNDKLNYLDCDNNQLTEINVSELPNLTNLDFRNNQVTEINISNNPSLRVLRFNDNQVSVLDISQNRNLQQIHCYNNRISTLDATTMHSSNWQLLCGNQTSDGVTPQDIIITLTDKQKEEWVSKKYNTNINNKRVIIVD
ncbi:MAG: Ig-like domain-containing protein, partial [Tannerellaceae bacterium]|nr:Ig-like domain-containing protein [Tannerellaceae bacterium]